MDALKIIQLKKEKNVFIMAHYYQKLEVQDIADVVGDSYALATLAQDAKQDTIILCGVRFMAESVKILNPDKTVYLSSADAGCPMADMVTPEDVINLRRQYPEAAVVCYVNSSAAVKAVSDVCCTSSSAVRIAKAIPQRQIIFVPDQNLGAYVAAQVPEKEVILFDGYCPTHHRVTGNDLRLAKEAHPNAAVLVHPECREEVLKGADYIGSTAGILDFAMKTDASELLIGTEIGVIDILQRKLPNKKIYALKSAFVCPNMKKTGLEDVLYCLEGKAAPINLSSDEMNAARASLERMISI